MNDLLEGLSRYLSPGQLEAVQTAHVGIAGAGGLGSNVALMLARSGIGSLTIVDGDVVERSNLNRQQYWPEHLGRAKVEALRAQLLALNPSLRVHASRAVLARDNIQTHVSGVPVWVECLDEARVKALFTREALRLGRVVVAASGLAGYGGAPMQKRRVGQLLLVGDFVRDIAQSPPLAPRVTQAAAMMADIILEYVLEGKLPD